MRDRLLSLLDLAEVPTQPARLVHAAKMLRSAVLAKGDPVENLRIAAAAPLSTGPERALVATLFELAAIA